VSAERYTTRVRCAMRSPIVCARWRVIEVLRAAEAPSRSQPSLCRSPTGELSDVSDASAERVCWRVGGHDATKEN
jgi:hypothetical protein